MVVGAQADGAELMTSPLGLLGLLGLLGCVSFSANDGVGAIEVVERVWPDPVIVDVGRPRLNGLDATRKLRKPPSRSRPVADLLVEQIDGAHFEQLDLPLEH